MLALVFDTETTGKYDFKSPPGDRKQPEVIQLCAKLSDAGKIVSSLNVFVHGEKAIEEGAYEAHRISREMTAKIGTDRRTMLHCFMALAKQADVLVGHNVEFDIRMLQSEMIRENGSGKIFQQKASFCTMKSSTDLCRIPSVNGKSGYKWPTLTEAYAVLVDPRGFSGAHDAEADVDACHAVYKAIRSRSAA